MVKSHTKGQTWTFFGQEFIDVGTAEDYQSLWKALSLAMFDKPTHSENIRLGAREFYKWSIDKDKKVSKNYPDRKKTRIHRGHLYSSFSSGGVGYGNQVRTALSTYFREKALSAPRSTQAPANTFPIFPSHPFSPNTSPYALLQIMGDFCAREIVVIVQTANMNPDTAYANPEFYVRGRLGGEQIFLLHDLQGDQGRGHFKLLKKIADAQFWVTPAKHRIQANPSPLFRVTLPLPPVAAGDDVFKFENDYKKLFAFNTHPLDTPSPMARYYDKCGPTLIEGRKQQEE